MGAGLAAAAGEAFAVRGTEGGADRRSTNPSASNCDLSWLSGMPSSTSSTSRKAASSLSVSGSPADTDTLSCSLTSGAASSVNT